MSDNVTSLFERYGAKEEMKAYRAYHLDKSRDQQLRLRVHYPDGSISALPYTHLVEVLSTSHQYLALFFSNLILSVEGRNLTPLVELLQDEKIRSLHCFHAERFAEPEEDAPLILRISRQSIQDVLKPSS